MKRSLESIDQISETLKKANLAFNKGYPGSSIERQPVHTVYGGAHLFQAAVAQKMSEAALKTLEEYAPSPSALAKALDAKEAPLWAKVYQRVVEKLKRQAVEDFRIDFEDGYGNRPDGEEDGHAQSVALELVKGMQEKLLPPFIGIRIKPFNDECWRRSVRTLDIFLSTLLSKSGGMLPENFVVTLPKITIANQSKALADLLEIIENKHNLKPQTLKFEIMVETPQSILDEKGACPLRNFVQVANGRCIGAHFGTYDYTASCNITAAYQMMSNPVCDFAKHMMQVAFAGTAIQLSDGATNVMPIGPHRALAGTSLTREQKLENEAVVHRAWRLSYSHIRHSLITGFYQGWDLHPAQIPVRYGAVYAFFLEGLEAASQRLKGFMEKAAKATLLGDVFDDAATGQGLLNFFLRGISCGAISTEEAENTGLTLEELGSRSFLRILEARKKL